MTYQRADTQILLSRASRRLEPLQSCWPQRAPRASFAGWVAFVVREPWTAVLGVSRPFLSSNWRTPSECCSANVPALGPDSAATDEERARRPLEAAVRGADAFIIAARDTVMRAPSRDLMNEVFPGVPVAAELEEHRTLLSIDKARRVLGYEAKFTWRELF
jgi:hypothetical protein